MTGSLYDQNVTLIAGCILIAFLGLWYYRLQKKTPDLDFGPLVATAMVDKHETIFMGVIFLEYIMTAIIASTVHRPGQTGLEMSPFGRLGLHIALSLTGTVAQFTLARDIAVLFIKRPIGEWVGNFFTTLIVTVIAFTIPYINLMLIASSLGESMAFDIWIYSHNPFVSAESYAYTLEQLGYPPNYRAWENISPVLHVCVASAVVVHYLLTAVEGLRTITSPKRRKLLMARIKAEQEIGDKDKKEESKGDSDKDKGKNPMPGQERQVQNAESNIKWLLRRIGYSGDKLAHVTNEVTQKVINPPDDGEQNKEAVRLFFASKLASWKLKGETIDKQKPDDKASQNEKLLKEFRSFVEGPVYSNEDGSKKLLLPKEKRGLGLKLKGGN